MQELLVLRDGDIIHWKDLVKITRQCIGHPDDWKWSEDDRQCVGPPYTGSRTLFVLLGVLLMAAVAVLLFLRERLRTRVLMLRNAPNEETSFLGEMYETPIMQAVQVLKEFSNLRFVTTEQQRRAMGAWKKLLSGSDLHVPDLLASDKLLQAQSLPQSPSFVRLAYSGNSINLKMVEYVLNKSGPKDRPVGVIPAIRAASRKSTELLFRASSDLTPEDIYLQSVLSGFQRMEDADDELLHAIGNDLMLDAFKLLNRTDRPLFTTVMAAVKKLGIITGLNISMNRLSRFLVAVEDGQAPASISCLRFGPSSKKLPSFIVGNYADLFQRIGSECESHCFCALYHRGPLTQIPRCALSQSSSCCRCGFESRCNPYQGGDLPEWFQRIAEPYVRCNSCCYHP